jgi:hypothetical protein
MYKIEKKHYGYKLTFGGMINDAEMKQWAGESGKVLESQAGKFGMFVDMRTLKPLSADAQATMVNGQALYKQKGMERSVVILESAVVTMQFKRLARESGIDQWERYVDASSVPQWEKVGEDWITKAIDPGK